MDNKKLGSKQDIHSLGVSYLCTLLDGAGFSILEWNTVPDHHYQILAKVNDKSLMIAVRTACHPDEGRVESSTLDTLIEESEKLDILPHFASISVIPLATNDIDVEGLTGGQEYRVIFNGISTVKNSALLAVNE